MPSHWRCLDVRTLQKISVRQETRCGLCYAGRQLEEGVIKQLKEHVKQGCQMAEEILTPASACHHALPLIIMEHSTILPDQAALWQAIVQVQFGTPQTLGILYQEDGRISCSTWEQWRPCHYQSACRQCLASGGLIDLSLQKLQLTQAQIQHIADWRTSVRGHMQSMQSERHAIFSQVIMHTLPCTTQPHERQLILTSPAA